jgi:hypothetical protein
MTETQTLYGRQPNERAIEARCILRDIDYQGVSTELVRFMRAMSLLYIDDPHMKVLRLASIIHDTMPRTIESYNGIK